MELSTRKSVFGESDQVGLKLACSATETSQNVKFSHVASLEIILSTEQMDPDAGKPVFGGLRTTKGPLLFAYWKVSYLDLLRAKFQFSSLSL